MPEPLFRTVQYPLSYLLRDIEQDEVVLPAIQRPFVWKPARVRDLLESMYRGYPVGHLLFWATGSTKPRAKIVDGQQRLLGLYSVLKGKEVVRKDFSKQRIRIAFRPVDGSFEVTNAAVEKDPEYIPDIFQLWVWNPRKAERLFIDRLESSRGELSNSDKDDLGWAISELFNLRDRKFEVVELRSNVDRKDVAEIFVRINSGGIQLNQADFVLTLMSVYWKDGRERLVDFARDAALTPKGVSSSANHFIEPSADQLLRVVAGLALKRARLRAVYQALRGVDPKTRKSSPELIKKRFGQMQKAQDEVLCLTNWHEFLRAVELAGYRSGKMISSDGSLLFSYLMYLIGHQRYKLNRESLREVIARWFFMTSLVGRYTGSIETRVERDLRRVADAKSANDFVKILDDTAARSLPGDYWKVQLPDALESSSPFSPTLFAYHASLVLLDARPLFSSSGKLLSELLRPSFTGPRSIERHHLFPRAYLKHIGVTRTTDINQIANFAFLDWTDNEKIKDNPPHKYFPSLFARLSPREQAQHRFWHALPEGWENMSYFEFLQKRRTLIADVVRIAYDRLRTRRLPEFNGSGARSGSSSMQADRSIPSFLPKAL